MIALKFLILKTYPLDTWLKFKENILFIHYREAPDPFSPVDNRTQSYATDHNINKQTPQQAHKHPNKQINHHTNVQSQSSNLVVALMH